jgi:hypothetical protein
MTLKDINSARASEEIARELVMRIPIVKSFVEEEEKRIDDILNAEFAHSIHPVDEELNKNKINSIAASSIKHKQIHQ